jgi:hypothetical protein
MKCAIIDICLLLAVAAGWAGGQPSSYDPGAKQQSKSHEGFMDFALKRINPQNIDYGRRLEEARKLVDQTIKRLDFWVVLVVLGFPILLFLTILQQHRKRNRREAITAEFLAQYHNAWVDARAQATEAVRRYNELVRSTNSASEAVFRGPSIQTPYAHTMPERSEPRRRLKPQLATAAAPRSDIQAGQDGADKRDVLHKPEVDLTAQLGTLQQQLHAAYEKERNLQKELAKLKRRAPAVQPGDASLPG